MSTRSFTLLTVGLIQLLLGQPDGSDPMSQANALLERAHELRNAGDLPAALGLCREGLALIEGHPATASAQATFHECLGNILGQLGEKDAALEHLHAALEIYKRFAGARGARARCYLSIGTEHQEAKRFALALQNQEWALALYEEARAEPGARLDRGEAASHVNIGNAYAELGHFEVAEHELRRGIELYQQLGSHPEDLAKGRANLGMVYSALGRVEEAVDETRAAVEMYAALGGPVIEEAEARMGLSYALLQAGRCEDALGEARRALVMLEHKSGVRLQRGLTTGHMAAALSCMRRFDESLRAYGEARAIVAGWWLASGQAFTQLRRGHPGDRKAAVEALIEATDLADRAGREFPGLDYRRRQFDAPSRVFDDLADLLLSSAVQPPEEERQEIGEAISKRTRSSDLRESAFIIADLGRGVGITELVRQRSAVIPEPQQGDTEHAIVSIAEAIGVLKARLAWLPEGSEGLRREILSEIGKKQVLIERKRGDLEAASAPETIGSRQPIDLAELRRTLSPGIGVAQYVFGETTGWLLLLTLDGLSVHRLALPKGEIDTRLESAFPPVQGTRMGEAWGGRDLREALRVLNEAIRIRNQEISRARFLPPKTAAALMQAAALETLGSVLFPAEALDRLRQSNARTLIISPGPELDTVPFAGLSVPDGPRMRYLVEMVATTYAPSLDLLRSLRERRQARPPGIPERSFLVFADPASTPDPILPRASGGTPAGAEEMEASGKILSTLAASFGTPEQVTDPASVPPPSPVLVFMKGAASERNVRDVLCQESRGMSRTRTKYALLYAHAWADPANGMLSGIRLSAGEGGRPDGNLIGQEIVGLRCEADLIMLPSCETALGGLSRSEGIGGFGAAFLLSGADSVILALWESPNFATVQLVKEFFERLRSGRMGRAEALREAQLVVMGAGRNPEGVSQDYSEPFFWAGPMLLGEYD